MRKPSESADRQRSVVQRPQRSLRFIFSPHQVEEDRRKTMRVNETGFRWMTGGTLRWQQQQQHCGECQTPRPPDLFLLCFFSPSNQKHRLPSTSRSFRLRFGQQGAVLHRSSPAYSNQPAAPQTTSTAHNNNNIINNK